MKVRLVGTGVGGIGLDVVDPDTEVRAAVLLTDDELLGDVDDLAAWRTTRDHPAVIVLTEELLKQASKQAAEDISARAMLAGIDLYQATLSPVAGKAGVRCRFEPTCSHYAEAVIRRDGALVGGGRATWRVLRCGPWTPAGTVDQP